LLLSPTYFDADNFNDKSVDRTIRSFVNSTQFILGAPSVDWFKICQLDNYRASNVNHVDFFFNFTKSMPSNDIPKWLAKFKRKCRSNGLKVKTVYENANYKKNWIAPFIPVEV
jgi:hypothetical protein